MHRRKRMIEEIKQMQLEDDERVTFNNKYVEVEKDFNIHSFNPKVYTLDKAIHEVRASYEKGYKKKVDVLT